MNNKRNIPMLKRSLYTFKQMLKHKKQISAVKKTNCLDEVVNLKAIDLQNAGVKYLALDFDGVLASHGKEKPLPQVCQWLTDFAKEFGEENIFILSNKPTQERLEFFQREYPNVRFIAGVAKKPYPDGMLKIRDILDCKTAEIALVDDRLLTGCLACIIAGSYPILITKPYFDSQNYDSKEKFFAFLRKWEQKIFF